jgi:hypothetical protein
MGKRKKNPILIMMTGGASSLANGAGRGNLFPPFSKAAGKYHQ